MHCKYRQNAKTQNQLQSLFKSIHMYVQHTTNTNLINNISSQPHTFVGAFKTLAIVHKIHISFQAFILILYSSNPIRSKDVLSYSKAYLENYLFTRRQKGNHIFCFCALYLFDFVLAKCVKYVEAMCIYVVAQFGMKMCVSRCAKFDPCKYIVQQMKSNATVCTNAFST